MSNLSHNFDGDEQHPPQGDFLLYVDGELNAKDTEKWESHLDACWSCRVRVAKIEETITEIIEFEDRVSQFQFGRSTSNWGNFDSRLNAVTMELGHSSIRNRFSDLWKNIGHLRSVALPVRIAVPTVAALLIIVVLYQFVVTPTIVSAEELINLAAASREKELKAADQPVLYQQLRVTRRGLQGEKSANVEIWQDVQNLRLRQVVVPVENQSSPPARGGMASASDDGVVGALTDLEQILRANKYEPPPMSILNFRAWRAGLAAKRDSVEELRNGSTPVLKLQTDVPSANGIGQITGSTIFLRAADYHPIEQHFRVITTEGEQTFEIRETSFAVMSLNSLNPGFFADSVPMTIAAKPALSEPGAVATGSNANTELVANNTNSLPTANGLPPTGVATAELEVEVTNALHTAGADLGEQIEVRRSPNGPINVTGVVETPQRKQEILNALKDLKDNPAVRVSISTVSEALAAEKGNKARPVPSVESIQVDTDSYPAEGDLLAHFGDAKTARTFAARMTGQSSRAMNYLWAMKRLKGQFGGAQVAKLTPDARTKLLNVVRSYAVSYQREIGVLRRELQPVFGGGGGGGSRQSIGSDAELLQTIDQLFTAGSGSNQVLRIAFLNSSSGTNALKTAQFWQMLSRAESLAESIEKYK